MTMAAHRTVTALGKICKIVAAGLAGVLGAMLAPGLLAAQDLDLGSRRELFVDRYLIERMQGVELRLGTPVDAGAVLALDKPWEGAFSAYFTVLRDGGSFRLYYRGVPKAGGDGRSEEVACTAESKDGIRWSRPELDLYPRDGARTNIVLAGNAPLSHNFSPFIDTRPGVPARERYKALAGIASSGLVAFASEDGYRWRKLRDTAVIPAPQKSALDSQNVAFWSEAEQCYVSYFRTWHPVAGTGYRWISRATSKDFLAWSEPREMTFGDAPPEHLYTNQTAPYFRAPHIYVAIAARFFPGKQVLTEEQARAVRVDPQYFKDCSDAVLLTSRGGSRYDRIFLEGFLRPGTGWENWVSRSNYPALNVVQTGPAEMSLYVARNYGQPTIHLRRYVLRLDGFASVHAGYAGGEFTTRPLRFRGSKLELNFATSAAGSVRVEILDTGGAVLAESVEMAGDEIAHEVAWKAGASVGGLTDRPVRVRCMLKDADLYALRFHD